MQLVEAVEEFFLGKNFVSTVFLSQYSTGTGTLQISKDRNYSGRLSAEHVSAWRGRWSTMVCWDRWG